MRLQGLVGLPGRVLVNLPIYMYVSRDAVEASESQICTRKIEATASDRVRDQRGDSDSKGPKVTRPEGP